MSMNSIITGMQNSTAYEQAVRDKLNGPTNDLDEDMFLRLMLEQLKYQDPMDPMDNQEFLAQQAQFTQLSELQELNDSITSNNTVTQAVSLIGKEVTLIDPNNPDETLVGIVEEAIFDANGSSIRVNGEDYPLYLVQGIREPGSSVIPPDPEDLPEDGTEDPPEGDPENPPAVEKNVLSSVLSGLTNGLSSTAKTITNTTSLISKYIK